MGSDEEKARTPKDGRRSSRRGFWRQADAFLEETLLGMAGRIHADQDANQRQKVAFVVTWDDWTPVITDPKEMEATADEESQRLRGPVKTLVITNILQASRWWMTNIRIPAKKDQERLFDAIYDMEDAPKRCLTGQTMTDG